MFLMNAAYFYVYFIGIGTCSYYSVYSIGIGPVHAAISQSILLVLVHAVVSPSISLVLVHAVICLSIIMAVLESYSYFSNYFIDNNMHDCRCLSVSFIDSADGSWWALLAVCTVPRNKISLYESNWSDYTDVFW